MQLAALFALDIVAVSVLTFGLYFPRHHRRDMVAAFLGINIGVLAVTQALSSAEISAGLGLGLFGVLSIIRLRSAEMEQEEVTYFFASLAMGLLGGFAVSPVWVTPLLMAAIVGSVFVGDHPRLFARHRHQVITLDRAFTDERELHSHLSALLGATVHAVTVKKVDLVHETTVAEVRYELRPEAVAPTEAYVSAEFEVKR